jgi:predicted nucleic acid-binding protein
VKTDRRDAEKKDSLIAATALANGLTVATRSRADFERARV